MREWYPEHPAIYDIRKTYMQNAEEGPFFHEEIPKRPKVDKKIDFFGFKVNSPIGVPAGPLLNARWVTLAAKLGFDIPTYKTIRSFAHPGHAMPNVIYVKPTGPHRAIPLQEPPDDLSELTITNSFGIPSRSPDYLIEDIAKANHSMGDGQVMIVSIVGTPNQGLSFLDDFVRTARFAKEAGAKIIEANFSCPNVDKAEGILYMNPETVYEYAKKISAAIGETPLILKMGVFPSIDKMRAVFFAAARGKARGICGINTLSMEVVDEKGNSPLGPNRKTSGVCGGSIRRDALQFLRDAAHLIEEEQLDLTLLGCGGIMLAEHFDEFLEVGAQIAMSATGMMWDPYLALRYHEKVHATPIHSP